MAIKEGVYTFMFFFLMLYLNQDTVRPIFNISLTLCTTNSNVSHLQLLGFCARSGFFS